MKAYWDTLKERYAAYSMREQALLAVAAVALMIFVGDSLWLSPIYARAKSFAQQTAQQEREFAALQQQLFALQTEASVDKNSALREALAGVEAELTQLDEQLAGLERALVPPAQMSGLLSKLLRSRPGVSLTRLRTLPVEPLDAAGNPVKEAGAASAFMFRHGFEVTLSGPYLELASWLTELESSAHQLLWESARLEVTNGQAPKLVLVFYTLSLDASWISL